MEMTYFMLQSVISVCAIQFLALGLDIHRGFARSDTGGSSVSGKLLELLIGIFFILTLSGFVQGNYKIAGVVWKVL